jgi:hypothetical protein
MHCKALLLSGLRGRQVDLGHGCMREYWVRAGGVGVEPVGANRQIPVNRYSSVRRDSDCPVMGILEGPSHVSRSMATKADQIWSRSAFSVVP